MLTEKWSTCPRRKNEIDPGALTQVWPTHGAYRTAQSETNWHLETFLKGFIPFFKNHQLDDQHT